MDNLLQRALYVISAAIGLGAVAFGGYMAWNLLNPPQTINGVVEPGCDLHAGPCRAVLPHGASISLVMSPRPIPLVVPIHFDVEITGLQPDKVEADVSNLDMYMGYNRRALTADGNNRYTGKTVLAACTRESMRWRVTILAKDGRETYSAAFEFATLTRNTRRKP